MSEEFDVNFFGNAFKFLDVPETSGTQNEESPNIGTPQPDEEHIYYFVSNWREKLDSPKVLDPEHPLLERFQQTLKEHLLKQIERLSEDIFALETSTKKTDAEREKLGVETYDKQQVVCKQQKKIEEYMAEIHAIAAAREEIENQVREVGEENYVEKQRLFETQRKELELREEVESLDMLIKQMSSWEDEVETELKTNQRISEKTKKVKIKLAEEKRELDMIIYRLMTEVWRIENEIETMNMQLRVKEEEKEHLAISVALSNTDIEALEAENRCLVHSWNSVVNAITQRDKHYVTMQDDLREINEQIKSTLTEIDQIKKLCNKEMLKNETLTLFKNRVEADMKNCLHILEGEMKKKDELEKKMNGYCKIIEATDAQILVITGENAKAEIEHRQLVKDFEKLSREKVEIEEKIIIKLQDQITNDKAAQHFSKMVRQIKEKNRDLYITLSSAENLNARTLMDIEAQKFINEQAARMIGDLCKQEQELEHEIKQLNGEIGRYQFLMRRKQREFDILSEKLDVARSKLKTTSDSTHEEAMRDLEKQIEEMEQHNKNLQKYWLREQENMVILTEKRQEQIKDNNLLRKQILILDQKNLKIGDELEALRKQEEKMNRNITALLTKQTMLQEAFNKKKGDKETMDRDNQVIQSDYLCNLQEAEMDALTLESELEDLEESKVNLSKDLIEKNREALAWEKKVQLVVETKTNMDKERSSEGEVGNMRAEIHRMNVRYSQLKKAQDKLIQDLEHCVSRRDAIITVADAREKRTGANRVPKINLQRKLVDLRNKIKKVHMDIEGVDKSIGETNEQEESTKEQIKNIETEIYDFQERLEYSKDRMEFAKSEKQQTLELLILKQKKLQMYLDIGKKRPLKLLFRNEGLLSMEYERQLEINNKLNNIVDNLVVDFPFYGHEFYRVLNSLKVFSFNS